MGRGTSVIEGLTEDDRIDLSAYNYGYYEHPVLTWKALLTWARPAGSDTVLDLTPFSGGTLTLKGVERSSLEASEASNFSGLAAIAFGPTDGDDSLELGPGGDDQVRPGGGMTLFGAVRIRTGPMVGPGTTNYMVMAAPTPCTGGTAPTPERGCRQRQPGWGCRQRQTVRECRQRHPVWAEGQRHPERECRQRRTVRR